MPATVDSETQKISAIFSNSSDYCFFPPITPHNHALNYQGVALKRSFASKHGWSEFYKDPRCNSINVNNFSLFNSLDKALAEIKKQKPTEKQRKLQLICELLSYYCKELLGEEQNYYPIFFTGSFIDLSQNKNLKVRKFGLDFFSDSEIIFYEKDSVIKGASKKFYSATKLSSFRTIGRLTALNQNNYLEGAYQNTNEMKWLIYLKNRQFESIPNIERAVACSFNGTATMRMIIYAEKYQGDLFQLMQIISSVGSFPLSTSLYLTKQLLHILCYLHKEKIVHGDIKAENLFVKKLEIYPAGKGAKTKINHHQTKVALGDWSCACKEGSNFIASGTYAFTDPLVFLNLPALPSTLCAHDTWSMGCVIWELFFDRPYPSYYCFSYYSKRLSSVSQNKEKIKQALYATYEVLANNPSQIARFFCKLFAPDLQDRFSPDHLLEIQEELGQINPAELKQQIKTIKKNIYNLEQLAPYLEEV